MTRCGRAESGEPSGERGGSSGGEALEIGVDVSEILRDVAHGRLKPLVKLPRFDFVVFVNDSVP